MTDEPAVPQVEPDGMEEFIQIASQGPVAELTPHGLLVTIFIPWSRIGQVEDGPQEG